MTRLLWMCFFYCLFASGVRCPDKGDDDEGQETGLLRDSGRESEQPRRLVVRHMGVEDPAQHLSDLGFVIEEERQEKYFVVTGGSDAALEELRASGARVARRPTAAEHERLVEARRSESRKARIKNYGARTEALHEDEQHLHPRDFGLRINQQSVTERKYETPLRRESRKQLYRTPTTEHSTLAHAREARSKSARPMAGNSASTPRVRHNNNKPVTAQVRSPQTRRFPHAAVNTRIAGGAFYSTKKSGLTGRKINKNGATGSQSNKK